MRNKNRQKRRRRRRRGIFTLKRSYVIRCAFKRFLNENVRM